MKLLIVFCSVLFVLSVKASPTPFINNGVGTTQVVPSYARIAYLNDQDQGFFGGGNIITASHILTAAHAIVGFVRWEVGVGSARANQLTTIIASGAVAHPAFNSATSINDIGIITLQTPLVFTATVQPIRIPDLSTSVPRVNEQGVIYGFGWIDSLQNVPNLLQLSYQRVTTDAICAGIFAQLIFPNHFCAVDSDQFSNVCWGDTGSGFIVNDRGEEILVGIASVLSGGCGSAQPTAYLRVAAFRAWINENTPVAVPA